MSLNYEKVFTIVERSVTVNGGSSVPFFLDDEWTRIYQQDDKYISQVLGNLVKEIIPGLKAKVDSVTKVPGSNLLMGSLKKMFNVNFNELDKIKVEVYKKDGFFFSVGILQDNEEVVKLNIYPVERKFYYNLSQGVRSSEFVLALSIDTVEGDNVTDSSLVLFQVEKNLNSGKPGFNLRVGLSKDTFPNIPEFMKKKLILDTVIAKISDRLIKVAMTIASTEEKK